jgi:hypothetical protein
MLRLAKPDVPIFSRCIVPQSVLLNQIQQNRMVRFQKLEGQKISRNSDNSCETMMTDPDDWRAPLIRYLENSGHIADRKVQRQALKYVMLDNTLYH